MKKPLVVTTWIVGILLTIAAILVFLVLPNCFGSSEEELKELENTNMDSLMNTEIPAEPVV